MKDTKLWLIRTDKMDPWWECKCCFYCDDDKLVKELFEVHQKLNEEKLFLEEIEEEEDLYSLDKWDVELLSSSGIKRQVGFKVFKDGNLDFHDIIPSDDIEKYSENLKKDLAAKNK